MTSVFSEPRLRLPVSTATDRNIRMAITGAIRVISDRYATDTDRQLTLHDLEIASKQHNEAMAKRNTERRHG